MLFEYVLVLLVIYADLKCRKEEVYGVSQSDNWERALGRHCRHYLYHE